MLRVHNQQIVKGVVEGKRHAQTLDEAGVRVRLQPVSSCTEAVGLRNLSRVAVDVNEIMKNTCETGVRKSLRVISDGGKATATALHEHFGIKSKS